MQKDNREKDALDNLSETDEDEVVVVTMTDGNGNETQFLQEMVIPVDKKDFAVLVNLDDDEDDNVIIARIDFNESGDEVYTSPTDEEFEAVKEVYENMEWDEE